MPPIKRERVLSQDQVLVKDRNGSDKGSEKSLSKTSNYHPDIAILNLRKEQTEVQKTELSRTKSAKTSVKFDLGHDSHFISNIGKFKENASNQRRLKEEEDRRQFLDDKDRTQLEYLKNSLEIAQGLVQYVQWKDDVDELERQVEQERTKILEKTMQLLKRNSDPFEILR